VLGTQTYHFSIVLRGDAVGPPDVPTMPRPPIVANLLQRLDGLGVLDSEIPEETGEGP
jgi:hypothetical protein